MFTYLKELKALRACKLLKELDASNSIVAGIDGGHVRQEGNLIDLPQLVLSQLQVLQVLVGVDLGAEAFDRGRCLLDSERGKSVAASVYQRRQRNTG